MTKWLKNDNGAVALITTIIISLLLGIIVTNLIGLMTSELHEQDDSEQATLAYFAAESGVEDAVGKILQAHLRTNQTTCGPVNNISATEAITCELITLSGTPTGTLTAPDSAVQIDTDGSSPFNKVIFQWDEVQTKFSCTTLTPAASWIAGTPCAPPLEVATVQYPRVAFAANATTAITKNALFMPTLGGIGVVNYGTLNGSNPVLAHCVTGGSGYHCTATLTGLSLNSSYVLRLRTRYLGTSYRVTAYNGNTPVDILDGSASIDVTARSGSAYRRVLYKVPYEKGVASGLDYVLYSDSQVCKDFYLLNGNVNPDPSACP